MDWSTIDEAVELLRVLKDDADKHLAMLGRRDQMREADPRWALNIEAGRWNFSGNDDELTKVIRDENRQLSELNLCVAANL